MRKKQFAVFVFALWLLIIAFFLLWIRLFDWEILFVTGFIGSLVILEILEPRYIQPGCLHYKNYFLAAGIVIFIMIVDHTILDILGLIIVIMI